MNIFLFQEGVKKKIKDGDTKLTTPHLGGVIPFTYSCKQTQKTKNEKY